MVNKISCHLEMECHYLVFCKFLILRCAVFIHYMITIVSIRFDVICQSYVHFGNSTRNGYSLDLLFHGIPSEYFSDNFETTVRESKMNPQEKGHHLKRRYIRWWVLDGFQRYFIAVTSLHLETVWPPILIFGYRLKYYSRSIMPIMHNDYGGDMRRPTAHCHNRKSRVC